MFELTNHLVFHQTLDIDIQSIFDFLKVFHDFLTSGNKFRSSIYKFLNVSGRGVRLKKKIENNSTWEGAFYQSKWDKINSSWVILVF